MGDESTRDWEFDTMGIHGGDEQNPSAGVSSPIYQSSTYHFDRPDKISEAMLSGAHPQFYGRYGTPNTKQVEETVARMEGGEAGLAVASGMAAISLVILNNLREGDHLVSQRNIYPTAYNFMRHKLPQMGIECTFVDQTNVAAFERAIRKETRLIYVESPANPILSITDLRLVAQLGKSRGLLIVADNTFATPYNQRPLDLGCDVVIHSATKYLSGHSDVVAGVIVSTKERIARMWKDHIMFGAVLHPMEAWLLERGLKTLAIRMEQHNANAMAIANHLRHQPAISEVNYPGLPNHKQYQIADSQMTRGFGGMVSFCLKDNRSAAHKFIQELELLSLAVSLGGVHSLISHPSSTISVVQSEEERLLTGVNEGLIRLSVGLEHINDIIRDLDNALSLL